MKIGTILTLEYKTPGSEVEKYHCKIIDKTEDELIIDYPIHTLTKKTTFFSNESTFSASYVADENAINQFLTKITRRVKLNVPGIAITIPDEADINRIQRREFVRVDATIDVAVHSQDQSFHPFTSITTDISGGGLSVIVSDHSQFKLEQKLDLWFVLAFKTGEYHYIHTVAQIVFIQSKNKINQISVKFLAIKQKEQQAIISYCFEKQREARKKELS